MEHTFSLKVRSYECDSYGHVNNAEYLHYLEAARMEFLNDIQYDYRKMRENNYAIYIAHVDISYKAPAFTNDTLRIVTAPIKRKNIYGTFRQTIYRDNTLIVEAHVTWVFVDEKGKPSKIPPELDRTEFNPA